MIPMKNNLEETYKNKIKEFRLYESNINKDWGGKRRLFKCVDTQLEIKFCKAEMLFNETLFDGTDKKKLEMIEMMYRAYTALIDKAESNGYIKLDNDVRCYKFKDNKVALVCDTELQMPRLKELYGSDKNAILFSVEELFRFIHPDYLEAKQTFKNKNIDITFKKVLYK